MRSDLVRKLQKLFWVIGWASIVLVVIAETYSVYQFFSIMNKSQLEFEMPMKEFSLFLNLGKFASGMAAGFFCLLVSSVFAMIANRTPAKKFDRRLLHTTCVWFAVEGLVGILAYGYSTFIMFGNFFRGESPFMPLALTILSVIVGLLATLTPFLYAITLFVLHRHFSKLVSFESQVV